MTPVQEIVPDSLRFSQILETFDLVGGGVCVHVGVTISTFIVVPQLSQ